MPLKVFNESRGTIVADQVEIADTFLKRLVGLMGKRSLVPGEGLFLPQVTSIHTFFMRFPIDVVFLDGQGVVVRIEKALPPFRIAMGGRNARATLELPVTPTDATAIAPGDRLILRTVNSL